MELCPACGVELPEYALQQSLPGEDLDRRRRRIREIRRCTSCRRIAARETDGDGLWDDAGTDPTVDYLFDWKPRPLPEPWTLLRDSRAALERQLRVEVGPGHPLFGKAVTAVARCARCDEVLFCIEEDPAWFARVHLTWRQGPHTPPWPRTQRLTMPLADSLTGHTH